MVRLSVAVLIQCGATVILSANLSDSADRVGWGITSTSVAHGGNRLGWWQNSEARWQLLLVGVQECKFVIWIPEGIRLVPGCSLYSSCLKASHHFLWWQAWKPNIPRQTPTLVPWTSNHKASLRTGALLFYFYKMPLSFLCRFYSSLWQSRQVAWVAWMDSEGSLPSLRCVIGRDGSLL